MCRKNVANLIAADGECDVCEAHGRSRGAAGGGEAGGGEAGGGAARSGSPPRSTMREESGGTITTRRGVGLV